MMQTESKNKIGLFAKKSGLYKGFYAVLAVIIPGCLWYFANDLSGDYGYFIWIAPVLVLAVSLQSSEKVAFLITLAAALIGKLSWFSYLTSIIFLVPTLIYMTLASLFVALPVICARKIVLRTNAWYSVFAFPVFYTIFEFVLLKFAPDGTAGSIAYSQLNYLPVIQIASVTGILGITFLLTLTPSAVALSWYFRKSKSKLRYLIVTITLLLSSAFLFGVARINSSTTDKTAKVGIVVLDEEFHHVTDHPDVQKEKLTAERYAKEIAHLAARGAQLVILPERAVNITRGNENEVLELLGETAKRNHVFIILGYTNFRTETTRNSALVIDANGEIIAQYDKARLIKVLEDQFTPGDSIATFSFDGVVAGTAICKDLDFADYINRYAEVVFLAIPAWDFVVDGWLHSRMAVLRGVENGFSEIRAARQGRLTISDCYGRIVKEADSSHKNKATLLGDLSLEKRNTIYGRFGEWFGMLNVIGAILLVLPVLRRNKIA